MSNMPQATKKSKQNLTDWLTKREAASVLQTAEKTIERLSAKGEIQKASRARPGLPPVVVYHPGDIERIRASREQPSAFVMPSQDESDMEVVGQTSDMSNLPMRAPGGLVDVLSRLIPAPAPVRKLFLSLKEASEYSGLPVGTLRQLMKDDKLQAMKTGAGFRIRKADLEKL